MLLPRRIWKDIKGWEGLYQVANIPYADKRQVRSVDRWITTKDGRKYFIKGTLMKSQENDGYLYIDLCKNSKMKRYSIHRLVAKAFIPNPDNLPQVNHKDENPSNNIWTNLEFCTAEYNVNYGTRNERTGKSMKGKKQSEESLRKRSESMKAKYASGYINPNKGKPGKNNFANKTEEEMEIIGQKIREKQLGENNPGAKKVRCITTGEIFDCIRYAEEKYHPKHNRNAKNIVNCLNGRQKTAYGMTWEYIEE